MRHFGFFILTISLFFAACNNGTDNGNGGGNETDLLSVFPQSLIFAADGTAQGTNEVTVSGADWEATTNASWIGLDPASGVANGKFTVTVEEGTEARTGTVTVRNTATGTTKSVSVNQSAPNEEPIEYIDLYPGEREMSGRYLGGDGASAFYLRIGQGMIPNAQGFVLEGFTTKAVYEDFIIAPGVYTVTEDAGAPFTLRPGWIQQAGEYNLVWGTFSFSRENDTHTERASIEGTVTVEYDNGTYTIKTDLTGFDAYNSSDVKDKIRYRYTGPLAFVNEGGDTGDVFGRSEGYYASTPWSDIFMLRLWRAENADFNEGVYLEGYCDSGTFNTYGYLPGSYYEVEDAMYSVGTLMPGRIEYGEVIGTFYFREGPVTFIPSLASAGNATITYDYDELLYTIDMTLSGTNADTGESFRNVSRQFKGSISFRNANETSADVPAYVRARMETLAKEAAGMR